MNRFAFLVCLLLIVPLTGQAQESVSVWPQWRGPNRDCLVSNQPWPNKLTGNHLKQLWRIPLDKSYSGPIVSTDRVFVTETVDKTFEVVSALDRKTGKQLWTTKWKGSMSVPFFAARNGSWIRSTPAFDGERLYVAGIRDVLVCLDTNTGKEIWKLDFVKKFNSNLPAFGFVCSPLVHNDHVYVQAGGSFFKLKKDTGEVVWRSLKDGGGMFGSAFSSPTLVNWNDEEFLLVQTRQALTGVDIKTGKVLWSEKIPTFRGMNILTPTAYGDGVYTSAYGGKSFFFKQNNKGKVTQEWTNKLEAYMSSPLVIGDTLYIHLKNRRFACVDLKTGKMNWITGKSFGQYWSMVSNGKKILALDEDGVLYLIRHNPKQFELLDERRISKDETWAHLAVCDNQVFVRELRAMAVYEWK